MDLSRFGGLVASLETTSPRRQIVKFLAGGAATGLVGLTMVNAADAKKKGKKKKNKKKQPLPQGTQCPTGSRIGTVSVPATGATVTTPVLINGQRYRLRATGFWSTNAVYGNDAFAAFKFATPQVPEKEFQGVRLGLSVDGGSPEQWGTYNPDHTYEMDVTGRGAPISLRFTDPITTDNSGSLVVDITCG